MKKPGKNKSPRRGKSAASPVPSAPSAPPAEAAADDSAATASASGGRVNNRGVLIQTLIALLDALLGKSPCHWLSLEPGDVKSEKFDLT
jgi:hypothetical protein